MTIGKGEEGASRVPAAKATLLVCVALIGEER